MKKCCLFLIAIISAVILQGCGGVGSSAPAPSNVQVIPGDGSATVSWTASAGVEYWIFKAAGINITPENCSSLPQCSTTLNAVSPTVVSGLTNGTTYSFTINGRINGGKGGPGSLSISVIPRLAGGSWTSATATGPDSLRGATFGGTLFVVVGDAGKIFSSTDGKTWNLQTSGVATNLNAVTYSNGLFVAVGAGGVVLTSSDAVTWTPHTSNTAQDLYAVAGNGATGFVATGAGGTIINSTTNGASWAAATVNPSAGNALNGITFGNSKYVAVGAGGTLQTSTDGNTWLAGTSNTASTLNGVAYAASTTTDGGITYGGPATFVAIGNSGTLVTSPDGTTWTAQTALTSSNLNAITYGRQFVAVGDSGIIYTSTNGTNSTSWNLATTPGTTNLHAVTHNAYNYSAVGDAGLNWFAM